MALLAVMWADPFGAKAPDTVVVSPRPGFDVAALPALPELPPPPPSVAGQDVSADPPSRPHPRLALKNRPLPADVAAVATTGAAQQAPPPAVVVAAVPAGQSPGDVNGAAMAANPSIGAPKADIDKDVASLTGRSGADMAKMQDLPGPQPEVSAVATVAPAVSTAAIALSDPGLQPPLILPPDVAIFALPPSASTTEPEGEAAALVRAAHELTKIPGGYDPKYIKIAYPMGDVPAGMGVCSDVIVRAFRGVGVDLQQLAHMDRFGTGDTNVDHRRVTVLMKLFARYTQSLPVSPYPESYKPGDIVAYDVPWGRTSKWHIAIVTEKLSPSLRPMVVHNRGYGAKLEDALFHKRIIGHYRIGAAYLASMQARIAPPAATLAPAVATGKPAPAPAVSGKAGQRISARATAPRS